VQDLENAGFQFESAEASFELLLRREIGGTSRTSICTTIASSSSDRTTRRRWPKAA
jgi:hypothetical protein